MAAEPSTSRSARLRELAKLFLKLGVLGFGGPAAHIAMMEDEVVVRRRWLTREAFLDMLGMTNLIPGPNSTEMSIHIGLLRAGLPGLIVAGVCFILPAALIVGALAWLYVQYQSLPQAQAVLDGIKPAMLAVMVAMIWRLGRASVKDWRLALLGVAALVLSLEGENELLVLFGGGILGMFWERMAAKDESAVGAPALLATGGLSAPATAPAATLPWLGAGAIGATIAASWWQLGLFFLKIGSLLYGSGYVLVAFLEGGLVRDHHWLTQQELLDAIAVGQFTPGPLFTTATFVGYLVMHKAGGSPVLGAAVATVGIFLPAFVFVALTGPLIPRLRRSPWAGAFLDAINVSSIALMAAVVLKLGREVLWKESVAASWPMWGIAVAAAALMLRYKVNVIWLVLGGALAGWLLR